MGSSFLDYATCFKSLSDDLRLRILFLLFKSGEKCVCELTEHFKISQSGISYHLKVLSETGLLLKRQEAVWNIYSFNADHFMAPMLVTLFESKTIPA